MRGVNLFSKAFRALQMEFRPSCGPLGNRTTRTRYTLASYVYTTTLHPRDLDSHP